MKLSLAIKLALAGSTLLAASAYADVATPASGNGELVLFVRDTTTSTTYARGLGVNTLDVLPQATVTANQPYTTPVATGYQLSTLAPDANLTAFLGGTHANDNFTWAIEGGKNGTGIAPGSFTYITSTHVDLSGGPGNVTNAALATVYPNLTATYNALNGQIASGVIGDKASTAAGKDGQWGNLPGNDNWYGAGPDTSGTLIGSTQNFYGLTTAGTTKSSPAEVFILNSLTLAKDGTLSAAAGGSPVPLPAAVWLLGSGLLGLFGVGRRRNAAAAA
jgi:hypothetical protein